MSMELYNKKEVYDKRHGESFMVIFQLDQEKTTVEVLLVGPRNDGAVYKQLSRKGIC